MQRDAGQIEHLQQVGVVELVLQRDAEKMGFGHRRPGLQGQQRDVRPAHLVDRVHPGEIGALDPHPVSPAGQVIEDLDRLVGDGDLVGVGEAENHPQFGGVSAESGPGARFLAYQPGRLPDTGEDGLERAVVPRILSTPQRACQRDHLAGRGGSPFLEVGDGAQADRDGGGVRGDHPHDDGEPGTERTSSLPQPPEAEAERDHARQLHRPLLVDALAVHGRDVEHHLRLVERHGRHVRAGDEEDHGDEDVLRGGPGDQPVGRGPPHHGVPPAQARSPCPPPPRAQSENKRSQPAALSEKESRTTPLAR